MHLADDRATLDFGAALAARLRPGDVVALSGDLGAGKTTLARGILAALGLAGEAPSPSFAIVQHYAPPETRIEVAHIDLYRIDDPDEAAELGLDDLAHDHLLLIEWPERLGASPLLAGALSIRIAPVEGGGRALTLGLPAAWEARWPA
ncbi:tRNA (adenosine(37)-N6)-threonylcarbamoyltransferase complex ATPase subunit type 1 TsaE [Sphingomonas changnyeongensis]|uniref:tRNA threonylcarbamoyladenosine biosynthesis protein TsaE n=1 Tax=Sphingomonas changnyeongensis TaxID=2698679 RepID=A0A7Z2NY23_9SPHN|nr:tRNA (adenosine(37)-N6)-threonylcarbamoyltransferase complex ATPase subunit type 1 TsaE [Sphingomonas changnyeongensis]QHL91958.1 tRNA (adenosine(37)-N6)-threonylcarbamoyltransferase complex ATPase subunit type 1 TsaE [Sphingomonas changnyeongensis]